MGPEVAGIICIQENAEGLGTRLRYEPWGEVSLVLMLYDAEVAVTRSAAASLIASGAVLSKVGRDLRRG